MDIRLITKKLMSSVICVVMAAVMIFSAAPVTTYGTETVPSQTVEAKAPGVTYAKRYTVSGYDITFNNMVVVSEFLGSKMHTDSLMTKAYRKSIKLTWSSVRSWKKITGYYIVRKGKRGRWYQIADVSRDTLSYTDKTANEKNVEYSYVLVPYAKNDGVIRIAKPSQWASAVTTRSKKKNVKSFELLRCAKGSAVRVGGVTKVAGQFASKACNKSVRWKSSNKKIAKITSNGKITGVSEGTATITAKAHSGVTFIFNITVVRPGTAEAMIDVMRSWMGFSYLNGRNMGIVDIYNSMDTTGSTYKMKYSDPWCDCAVSAAGFVSGNYDKIGRECSVPRHITIFRKKGIWIEGCNTVPKPGDIVVFNWSPRKKNNASHIGIVESVEGNKVTTIEGNMGLGIVGQRTYNVGWKYIRGYARPDYIIDSPDGQDAEDAA